MMRKSEDTHLATKSGKEISFTSWPHETCDRVVEGKRDTKRSDEAGQGEEAQCSEDQHGFRVLYKPQCHLLNSVTLGRFLAGLKPVSSSVK
jgi:hypothetical protein